MKKITCILLVLAMAAGVCAKKKSSAAKGNDVVLTSTMDSVSYAVGVSVGVDVKKQLLERFLDNKQNNKVVAEAFLKAISGDSVIFSKRQADSISSTFFAAEMKKKNDAWKTKNTNFLATNSKAAGVMTTESGLQYKMIKSGNGKKPSASNTVKVHYEGKLIDGTVFDSSRKRREPIEFRLDQVIKGWTEGLQLMDEGSVYELYIPYELGYGERPMGNIPAYSTLVFNVELLEIK